MMVLFVFFSACDGADIPTETQTETQSFAIALRILDQSGEQIALQNAIGGDVIEITFTKRNVPVGSGRTFFYRITGSSEEFSSRSASLFTDSNHNSQVISVYVPSRITDDVRVAIELFEEHTDGSEVQHATRMFTISPTEIVVGTTRDNINEGESLAITFEKTDTAHGSYVYNISGVELTDPSLAQGTLFSRSDTSNEDSVTITVQKDDDAVRGVLRVDVRASNNPTRIIARATVLVFDLDVVGDCAGTTASTCQLYRSVDARSGLPVYNVHADQGRITSVQDEDWFRVYLNPSIFYEVTAQTNSDSATPLIIQVSMLSDRLFPPQELLDDYTASAEQSRAIINTHHASHWVRVRGQAEGTGSYTLQIKQYTKCATQPDAIADYHLNISRQPYVYAYQLDSICTILPDGGEYPDAIVSDAVDNPLSGVLAYNSSSYSLPLKPSTPYRISLIWDDVTNAPQQPVYLRLWGYLQRPAAAAAFRTTPRLYTITQAYSNFPTPENAKTLSLLYTTTSAVRQSAPLILNVSYVIETDSDRNLQEYNYPYKLKVEEL